MLSALAATAGHGPAWGVGLWWLGPVFTVIWIGLLVALIVVIARRRGRGPGPWGSGPWHGAGPRSAESTLAERYANGDIDEKEYRARLEVLRATGAPPSA